jgi:hypothetical protein
VEVLVEQSRVGLEQPGNLLVDSGDLFVVSCGVVVVGGAVSECAGGRAEE